MSRPIYGMKRIALALLGVIALRAEPVVLLRDAAGQTLRQVPAVLRPEGNALMAREALYGAAAATLFDDGGNAWRVLWVDGEDRDSGVVRVFVGRQAPSGPDRASQPAVAIQTSGHSAKAGEYKDAGGFGPVARLDCPAKGEVSGPLYNEHGFLAGWHAIRVIDGQALAFAIPLARVESGLQPVARLGLAEWNAARNADADAVYTRALGHTWAADFDGASFYWRKAAEGEPANPRVWFHLAFAEGKTGHSREKTRCFRKAIELDPDFAEAHYHLGIGLALAGDYAGAGQELKALQRLDDGLARRLHGFLSIFHSDELPEPKKGAKPTTL